MKVFTQAEFDSLPVVDGVKQCPTGDYSQIKTFGEHCRFGKSCIFGMSCSFGKFCSFGVSCDFGMSCNFGEHCSFDEYCNFGKFCSFGESCSFSAFCRFSALCRFGVSCSFGKSCNFGKSCRFGKFCSFGVSNHFGNECTFTGRRAHPGYPLLALSGAGSVNRTVYAFNVEGGPWFEAGCFSGDLDAFRTKVRADGDELKCIQYLGFANIVAATWCPERIEA